jgi:cold shock CspA family protein
MEQGVVEYYNQAQDAGSIVLRTGNKIFFNSSGFGGTGKIFFQGGETVSFEIDKTDIRGPRAVNIKEIRY